ncbi:MAG: response regulator transcription factor [Chloroflexi bacterium]|nr:response regulator transcription factor [Chloroflexota bacterium]
MTSMNVLVISDTSHVPETIETCVAMRWPDYAVTSTNGKESAMHDVRRFQPDLIVLDLSLSRVNPLVIVRAIREQTNVPMLVLSEPGDRSLPLQAMEEGADIYLPKPLHHLEFLARIQAICRRWDPHKGFSIADPLGQSIYLDASRQCVQIDGREVSLTPKEWLVLDHLLKNEGCVVSHAELLRIAWDKTTHTTAVVKKSIAALRCKLGDNPKNPSIIRSHRGRGYSFSRPKFGSGHQTHRALTSAPP